MPRQAPGRTTLSACAWKSRTTENDANPLFRLLAKYITPIKGDPDDQ